MMLLRYKATLLVGYGANQFACWAIFDRKLRLWAGPAQSKEEAKRIARRKNWNQIPDAFRRIKARWDEWVGCYP